VAQPRPPAFWQVRQITAQLGGQPADDHRVAEVGPVPGEVLTLPQPVHQRRLHRAPHCAAAEAVRLGDGDTQAGAFINPPEDRKTL
jgi:hypothetical protein